MARIGDYTMAMIFSSVLSTANAGSKFSCAVGDRIAGCLYEFKDIAHGCIALGSRGKKEN